MNREDLKEFEPFSRFEPLDRPPPGFDEVTASSGPKPWRFCGGVLGHSAWGQAIVFKNPSN